MYYVYILKLRNNNCYTGYTSDLKKRIQGHEKEVVKSTKDATPIKLVFYAAFISKIKAIKLEKYLKSSSGFAFRNKHLIDR